MGVFVVGMHRSGTSAIAAALEASGLSAGEPDLLQRAGHKVPTSTVSLRTNRTMAGVSLRAIEELDPEDQADLREYLAYLQLRKKRRR